MGRLFSTNILKSTPALALYTFAAVASVSAAAATSYETSPSKLEVIEYARSAPPSWCKQSRLQCVLMDFFDLGD